MAMVASESLTGSLLFLENKIDGKHQKTKPDNVVYAKLFIFKHQKCEEYENRYGDNLLNYLQLNERERPSVTPEANPVGRNLEKIFKKCNTPADKNY